MPPLSGRLVVGDPEDPRRVQTTFSRVANDPAAGAVEVEGGHQTDLVVGWRSGSIVGHPHHVFGDGLVAVRVFVDATGDARLIGGALPVLSPAAPDLDAAAGLEFAREDVTLLPQGALARNVILNLPPGFGITPDPRIRMLRRRHLFVGVFLNGDLQPRQDPVVAASDIGGDAVFGNRDGIGVWIASPWMRWRVAEGELELAAGALRRVGEDEDDGLAQLQQLPEGVLADPRMGQRRSNGDVFRFVRDTGGQNVRVRVGTNGVASMDATLTFGPGDYAAHFPHDLRVGWEGHGRLVFRADRVVPEESSLAEATIVALSQDRACPHVPCAEVPPPVRIQLDPAGAAWRFTEDMGLVVSGRASAQRLEWGGLVEGSPVHRVGVWTTGSALMAGSRLSGSEREGRVGSDGPGILLLSGHGGVAGVDRVERPGTAAYEEDGLADYPGINFRVVPGDGFAGESVLAGLGTGAYPLSEHSRFHVRPAGVNGRLDARMFPGRQRWYGFDFRVDGLSLAWLDSRNVDSRTSGQMEVPFPSGFELGFRNLTFGCGGQLGGAEPVGSEGDLQLDHWQTVFRSRTISFRPVLKGGCASPSEGGLVLGADLQVPLARRRVPAVLGFVVRQVAGQRWGDLARAGDGLGVDSRIWLPSGSAGVRLPSASGLGFGFTPAAAGYFSRYEAGVVPGTGFLNLAGELKVAFFEGMPVHLQLEPALGIAGIHVLGGWSEGGRQHFNDPGFDPDQRGFPAATGLDAYRAGGVAGEHLPRVHQTWLDFVRLDLPVRWAGAARRTFESGGDGEIDLRLVRLPARVSGLGPEVAELGFGAEIKDLARFTTDRLLADAAGLRGGIPRILGDAMGDVARAVKITAAVGELDALTSPRVDGWLKEPVRRGMEPLVAQLVRAYVEACGDGSRPMAAVRGEFCSRADVILDGAAMRLALDRVMQGDGVQGGLLEDLRGRLGRIRDGVTSARDVLAPGPDGRRSVIRELARRLARSPEAGLLLQQLADATIAGELDKLEEPMEAIHSSLVRLSDELARVEAELGGGGALGAAIQGAVGAGPRITALGAEIRKAVCDRLTLVDGTPGRILLEHPEAQFREALHAEIRDRVFGSVVPERVGLILRGVLEPSRGIFRQALDGLFAEVNQALEGAVLKQFGDAILPADVREAEGALSGRLRVGKLNGNARFRDEAIDGVRLDGRLELVLEDSQKPFGFRGWIEAGNAHADQPASDCRPAGARDVTLRIGAEASGVAGYGARADGAQLQVDADLRVALEGGSRRPIGMDGVLGLRGALDVGDFGLRDVRLRFAAGAGGGHLSGVVRGDLNGIDADIRCFLGRVCDVGVLDVLDPATAEILKLPEYQPASRPGGGIAGFYFGADGSFPLEKLLGLPATPAISLRGSGGNAWFGFAVLPAPGRGTGILVGRRIHQGVDGHLLGSVTLRGDYHLAGALGLVIPPGRQIAGFLPDPTEAGVDAIVSGAGSVEAKAGAGPFQVGGSVPLKVLLKLRPALRPPGFPPFSEACYRITVGDLIRAEGCTP